MISSNKVKSPNQQWQWILLLLSVVYLLVELVFNTTLLNTASSIEVNEESLNRVELFGRSVSGAGFALLILGLMVKMKFNFSSKISKTLVILFSLICLAPFTLNFSEHYLMMFLASSISAIILIKQIYNNVSKKSVALIILSTITLTWLAMFAGQKILIERYLINSSSWETRLNAQYMQLLTTGLAENIVKIEAAPIDPKSINEPEEKTFFALIGALIMQSPEFITLVKDQENEIIKQFLASHRQDDLPERYAAYSKEADSFQFIWTKYKNGSKKYDKATKTSKSKAENQYIDILNQLDEMYENYNQDVNRYRNKMAKKAKNITPELKNHFKRKKKCKSSSCREQHDRNYEKKIKRFMGKAIPWTYWCNEREDNLGEKIGTGIGSIFSAPVLLLAKLAGEDIGRKRMRYDCNITRARVVNKLMVFHNKNFVNTSDGYNHDISDREVFIAHDTTSRNIRKKIRQKGIKVPIGWSLTDKSEFIKAVKKKIHTKADKAWRSEVINATGEFIKPGLGYERLVQHRVVQNKLKQAMADAYFKGMTFEYNERDFKRLIIDPESTKQINNYVHKLHFEAHEFANGSSREDEGKGFLRAILIPPISLFLSLFFALLTTGKSMISLINLGVISQFKTINNKMLLALNILLWGALVTMAIRTPYLMPNKFSESKAYNYFSERAYQHNPIMTQMTDWTIRMQPIMYPVGYYISTRLGLIESVKTKVEPLISTDKLPLVITTNIKKAKVRIMNIVPIYKKGMMLKNNNFYTVEVSYSGYKTITNRVKLTKNKTTFHYNLEER